MAIKFPNNYLHAKVYFYILYLSRQLACAPTTRKNSARSGRANGFSRSAPRPEQA